MSATKMRSFDDWKQYFKEWQAEVGMSDIGLPQDGLEAYEFHVGMGDLKSDEVEFGDFKGQPKWEKLLEIPDQRARDTLMELIRYQGDTEFASTEQQRNLLETAPTREDLHSLIRVIREEGRHGWQMAWLLTEYFGEEGKREAQKLLERRSIAMSGTKANRRLLWAFNEEMPTWLDAWWYTELVDRDGKFQLEMLSRCGFAPLARSTVYMLGEEAYHMRFGHLGVKRVMKQGVIPVEIMQKLLNKWFTCALDLFGKDASSTAIWTYVWGLKSRFNEHKNPPIEEVDRLQLNEMSRSAYAREVQGLIDQINRTAKPGSATLVLPSTKFNRKIGEFAEQPYSASGELLSAEAYQKHLEQALPTEKDYATLDAIFKSGEQWVAPPPNKDED